jgi:uncharacterized protein YggT (Ycf19 family)
VGDLLAIVDLLATARGTIAAFIHVFIYVYLALIFAWVLLSWFQLPYSSVLSSLQRFLNDVCGPYLALFRRVIPPVGPLDLSAMAGMFVLIIIDRVVARVL